MDICNTKGVAAALPALKVEIIKGRGKWPPDISLTERNAA